MIWKKCSLSFYRLLIRNNRLDDKKEAPERYREEAERQRKDLPENCKQFVSLQLYQCFHCFLTCLMNMNRRSESFIRPLCRISRQKMFSGLCPPFFDGYACVKSRIRVQTCSKLNRHVIVTRLHEQISGTVPRLPVPRLPLGGSLGTGKI